MRSVILSQQGQSLLNKARHATQVDAAEMERKKRERLRQEQELHARYRQLLASSDERRMANAFVAAIVHRAKSAAASWGLSSPIYVKIGSRFAASTDFRSANISYPQDSLPRWNNLRNEYTARSEHGVEMSLHEVAEDMLGVIYHELGHIRFSLPFDDLRVAAKLEETLAAFRRAEPQATFRECPSGGNCVKGCQGVHRVYPGHSDVIVTTTPAGMDRGDFDDSPQRRKAWNAMEDQRMELCVAAESPTIRRYLTRLALTHLGPSWPLLAGRAYLPAELRSTARDTYVISAVLGGADRVLADTKADRIEEIIYNYISATTPSEAWRAVLDFAVAASDDLPQLDDHADNRRSARSTPEGTEGARRKLENSASKPDLDVQGGDDDEDGAGGDEPGEGSGGEGDEPGDGLGASADGERSPYDPATQKDMFNTAAQQLLHSFHQDESYRRGLDMFAKSLTNLTGVTDTPEDFSGSAMEPEHVAEAEALVKRLMESFQPFVAQAAPCWQFQQRSGILDVRAYAARQPGQYDFYRSWSGVEDIGRDIAVTVIADVSGTMNSYLVALGQAIYAAGRAATAVGAEYLGVVFGSDSAVIATPGRIEPTVPDCRGGTVPQGALEIVRDRHVEASNHLVLLMTDGLFSGTYDLRDFIQPNMHLLGMGFSSSESTAQQWADALVEKYHCPTAVPITSLQAIPQAVVSYISSIL